jgi:hypothetical protein
LSIENYCSGPNPDYNSTEKGAIWIFGIKEYGMMIYIKLKIAYAYNHEIAKCLSFHPAEYSLNFPYK